MSTRRSHDRQLSALRLTTTHCPTPIPTLNSTGRAWGNMKTCADIKTIEDSIADMKQCLSDLEPGLCGDLGRTIGESLGTEILQDPRRALYHAVWALPERLIRYGRRCGRRVPRHVREHSLAAMGPVEIVFGCLPDPEAFERSCEGDLDCRTIYNCAHEMLTYLVAVFRGRGRILAAFDDPLLRGLLSILDHVGYTPLGPKDDVSRKDHYWREGLRSLAWDQLRKGTEAERRYMPHTRRVLEYLRWVVLGRKDLTCRVRKPWAPTSPKTLNWNSQLDLRRLFVDRLFGRCSYCSTTNASHRCVSCQPRGDEHLLSGTVYCNERCLRNHSAVHAASCKNTRELFRRALLFQDAFNQYLVATQEHFPFAVWMENGVVRRMDCKPPPAIQPSPKSLLVKFSSRMDLSRPGVEAALHSYHCNDIRRVARALLDLFIGREYYFHD